MKLLFLGDALAEHLQRWSRYFVGLGHEVHVITWNPRILGGYEPAVVHQLVKPLAEIGILSRSINLVRLRAQVRRLIRTIRPDLIHAHGAGAYAWMAMATGFHPYLVTPWGEDVLSYVHQRAVDRFFTAWTLRRADWLHCEGENTKEAMLRLGADPRKILVLPFGIDLEKYVPGEAPCAFIDQYGLAGAKVVVSARTLTPVHNVETLIRAAAIVLQKAPAVKFLVVGGGVERQALQELAGALGIGRSIIFVGHVAEREMIVCLQASDVYVSTSLSESGTSLSMAEAMGCGLPIINTDTGDIGLWLRNGEGGYIVPVKSPAAVAEKILHLLEHDDERQHAGKVNRRLMEESYDVCGLMRRIETVYSELVMQARMRRSW